MPLGEPFSIPGVPTFPAKGRPVRLIGTPQTGRARRAHRRQAQIAARSRQDAHLPPRLGRSMRGSRPQSGLTAAGSIATSTPFCMSPRLMFVGLIRYVIPL